MSSLFLADDPMEASGSGSYLEGSGPERIKHAVPVRTKHRSRQLITELQQTEIPSMPQVNNNVRNSNGNIILTIGR